MTTRDGRPVDRWSRVSAVATALPPTTRTTQETHERLHRENPGMRLPVGLIERVTGVRRVRVADDATMASDLAADAVRRLVAEQGLELESVDLLVFASATQDLIEPATAHIVAAGLGLECPVFDLKNACNSVLNAVEVADSLVRTGAYRRILVCSGEKPSVGTRWRLDRADDFLRSFAGYTMSDAGAALVVEATTDPDGPRILGTAAAARSSHWPVGVLGAGGTRDPDATTGRYFDMDGRALFDAFEAISADTWRDLIHRSGTSPARASTVAVHQVALAHLDAVRATLDVERDRLVVTIADHGNMASATLPRQLELAREAGGLRPGDESLLVGLAGGISVAAMGIRW